MNKKNNNCTVSTNSDGRNILREKIRKTLAENDRRSGKDFFHTGGTLYKVSGILFIIFGFYGIFTFFLNIVILLGAVSGKYPYSDSFRSLYFPVISGGVLIAASLVFWFLKKRRCAAIISVCSLIPEIIHLIQCLGIKKVGEIGYKNLLFFYLALLVYQLSAFAVYAILASDRRRESRVFDGILKKIYAHNQREGEILSDDELNRLCSEYEITVKKHGEIK